MILTRYLLILFTFPIFFFLSAEPMKALSMDQKNETSFDVSSSLKEGSSPWMIEPGIAYFFPQAKLLREIYHCNWVNYNLSLAYTFYSNWSVALRGEYMENRGHTKWHNRTKIWMVPANFTFRYLFSPLPTLSWYLGIGPRYTYVKERNEDPVINKHVSKHGLGGIAELGARWWRSDFFAFDFFVNYSYVRAGYDSRYNAARNNLNVGGLHAGLGFSFFF